MILVVDDDLAFLEQAQHILNRERQVFLAAECAAGVESCGTPRLLRGAG
jgi:hypothetical protein